MNNTVPKKVHLVRKPFLAAGILILVILVAIAPYCGDLIGTIAAIMGWHSSRTIRNACVSNLLYIKGAKDQYALEYGGTNGTMYTWSQLSLYAKDASTRFICLSSRGKRTNVSEDCYSIEPYGSNPICRVRGVAYGHALTNR